MFVHLFQLIFVIFIFILLFIQLVSYHIHYVCHCDYKNGCHGPSVASPARVINPSGE